MDGDAVTLRHAQIPFAINTLKHLYLMPGDKQSPRQFRLQNVLTAQLKQAIGDKRLGELISEWNAEKRKA
jgi:hypothetical protein